MTLKVNEIADSEIFNNFAEKYTLGNIQQIYEWGKFQAKSANRNKFWPLAVKNEQGEIVASALVISQKLPFGKCWLYCPRGPLSNPSTLKVLLERIKVIAKQEKAIFFRLDPSTTLKVDGARKAHAHYQPESTNIIDLTLSEEEILKQMKPKGRYNIKVAQKHEVNIQKSENSEEDIKQFYEIFSQTTNRDRFTGHPLEYYKNMLSTLGENRAKLYLAKYQGKTLAAAIITYCGSTATYYFGASSNENRNAMAPYLLHWEIIKDAKKQGFTEYDFFGIAPENAKNHPWAGVSNFKLKFGGNRVNYPDAQEIIYKPIWFTIIKIVKHLKGVLKQSPLR